MSQDNMTWEEFKEKLTPEQQEKLITWMIESFSIELSLDERNRPMVSSSDGGGSGQSIPVFTWSEEDKDWVEDFGLDDEDEEGEDEE